MSDHRFSHLVADTSLVFMDDQHRGRHVFHTEAAKTFKGRGKRSLAQTAMENPGEWFSMGATSMMSSRRVPVGFEEIALRDMQRSFTK